MGVLELPIHFPKVRLPFLSPVAPSRILLLMTFLFFPFLLHLQNACPQATVSGAVSQQKVSIWMRGRLCPLALPCYASFWSQSPTCNTPRWRPLLRSLHANQTHLHAEKNFATGANARWHLCFIALARCLQVLSPLAAEFKCTTCLLVEFQADIKVG